MMNKLFTASFLFGVLSLMSTSIDAKNEVINETKNDLDTVDIIVQVNNIDRSKPGNILVMLYGRDGFPKDHAKALHIKAMPAAAEQMTIGFSAVPAEFAIKILHDEDENGLVTKNWTGIIPAEGLGFSNGAKLSYRAPRFSEAKLTLANVLTPLTINIIYP